MTHLYLVRHGDYIYERVGDLYQDLGLSAEGIKQAEALRDRLARTGEIVPDVFMASTARRAQEPAAILQPVLNQTLLLDKDLEEWRSEDGTLSPEEFMERWQSVPPAQKAYYRWVEGGESRIEFMLRVQITLNRILQAYEGKTILIISHGAFIQSCFAYFFGYGEASINRARPDTMNTSIMHWMRPTGDERWVLERSNDYHHLMANQGP